MTILTWWSAKLVRDFFHCNIWQVELQYLDQLAGNVQYSHNKVHNRLCSMRILLSLFFAAMDLLGDMQSETYSNQKDLKQKFPNLHWGIEIVDPAFMQENLNSWGWYLHALIIWTVNQPTKLNLLSVL